MRPFDHVSASSAHEAIAALNVNADETSSSTASKLIAGGTDLLTLMKADLLAPTRLIDVKPIHELRYITFDDDGAL
ncbi:MAG: FAD binding domain-containing protein, partial [Ktedonobacterales bacterium]